MQLTEQELLNAGIGRSLNFLGRAADMISVLLSPSEHDRYEYAIHIMADGAIFYKGKLLTNTQEMFEQEDAHMKSKYDEKVHELLNSGKSFILKSISYDANLCLSLKFSHELEIRSFPENTVEADDELWRIFSPRRNGAHLVASNAGIELEQPDCTQVELN